MNDTKTIEFRTADDFEKLKRAEKVCAKHDDLVSSATSSVASAEEACSQDPSDANIAKAKDARRALADAEQGLALATASSKRMRDEVADKETKAIREKIARREAAGLTEIADDESCMIAVDMALSAIAFRERTAARAAMRLAEIEELRGLRTRLGENADPLPSVDGMIRAAVVQMTELALSAQAQSGVRAADIAENAYRHFPFWRGGGPGGPEEFVTGVERFHVVGTTAEGTPLTMGKDRTPLVKEAKALLDRVKARRADRSGGSSLARVAAAGATVLALATAAAFTLAGGS